MKNRMNPFVIVLLTTLFLASCASPQRLIEAGNFDQAIEVASRRLKGKKHKKTKHVLALESAFNRANQRDMRDADRLKRQGRPENWPKINRLYQDIRLRQRRLEPFLPLISKEGIKANFRFVKVDQLENESRKKSAEFHYAKAQNLIRQADRGDRLAARQAYDELVAIDQYFANFRDKQTLKEKARDLGTTRVLVKMKNDARVVLPRDLERDIRAMSVRDLNSFWKAYFTEQARGVDYDYEVVMRINRVEVSPGLVKERSYEESNRVRDGFRYVLDENGNVAKDSLGNDIKEPRIITVRAQILENYQIKEAFLSGRLEFYDKRTGDMIDSRPMATEAIFENYASTFRGDQRALSAESKSRIGNQPQPFPSDESLLFEAAEQLKPFIKREIAATRKMI
jgi:hypothetical protein